MRNQTVMVCAPRSFASFWLRWSVAAILFFGSLSTIPRWWCGLDGEKWFAGDPVYIAGLAREVAATIDRGVSEKEFTSDSSLFRHEWQFGTYQMAALGLLQVCMEHPEYRGEFLPVAERAIDKMLSADGRAFDAKSWGEDPLASLDGDNGHAAYLGYCNIVLGLHHRVVPQSRFATLNDRISNALARRLRKSSCGILEAYPDEAYPVDNASVVASLLLHQKVSGGAHDDVIASTLRHYTSHWRDPQSGLLYQAIDVRSGLGRDKARASGTALAAYFLSVGARDTAASLFQALKRNTSHSVAGFGFICEYPEGVRGHGDIDSGPIILGISPSGTGFTLASCRAFNDRGLFLSLYRTAHLTGAPISNKNRRQFVTGGPLGNAIMLALLTAQPAQP